MDGGVQEKKVLQEFQARIKENLRKKRSYHPAPARRISAPLLQHEALPAGQTSLPTPPYTEASPSHLSFNPYGSDMPAYDSSSSSSPLDDPCSNEISRKEFQTTLLMHYLDHVFPLQFSCYTPPVTEMGRGWLLALLTRTKPLYHAALALSSFYMYSVLLKTGRTQCIQKHYEEAKRQHALAFKELQLQLQLVDQSGNKHLKGTIETVACIIQMIMFEVSTPLKVRT